MRTKHREDQMPQTQQAHGSLPHGRLDQGLRSKGREDTSTGTETKGERHTETKAGDVCVGRDKNSERDGQKRRDRKRGKERVRDEG